MRRPRKRDYENPFKGRAVRAATQETHDCARNAVLQTFESIEGGKAYIDPHKHLLIENVHDHFEAYLKDAGIQMSADDDMDMDIYNDLCNYWVWEFMNLLYTVFQDKEID